MMLSTAISTAKTSLAWTLTALLEVKTSSSWELSAKLPVLSSMAKAPVLSKTNTLLI